MKCLPSTIAFSVVAAFVLSMITRAAGGEISFHLEGKSVRQK